ncbi:hypothetical protein LguiA_007533 [Lonicera macranthoides]
MEDMEGTHSEKLDFAIILLASKAGTVIRVVKNLKVCWDFHMAIKIITKMNGKKIILRDNHRFHFFKDGHSLAMTIGNIMGKKMHNAIILIMAIKVFTRNWLKSINEDSDSIAKLRV